MSLRSNGHGCGIWYMPKARLLSFDNSLAIFSLQTFPFHCLIPPRGSLGLLYRFHLLLPATLRIWCSVYQLKHGVENSSMDDDLPSVLTVSLDSPASSVQPR